MYFVFITNMYFVFIRILSILYKTDFLHLSVSFLVFFNFQKNLLQISRVYSLSENLGLLLSH